MIRLQKKAKCAKSCFFEQRNFGDTVRPITGWALFSGLLLVLGCGSLDSGFHDASAGINPDEQGDTSLDGVNRNDDNEAFVEEVDWLSLEENGEDLGQIWCSLAQYLLENDSQLNPPDKTLVDTLFKEVIVNTIHDTKTAFVNSKPSVTTGKIHVETYFKGTEQPGVSYDQVWCKFNTQEQINRNFDPERVRFEGKPSPCSLMNERALDWVFSHVTENVVGTYESVGVEVRSLPDRRLTTGSEWVDSRFRFERNESNIKAFDMQSTNLRTSMDWIWESLGIEGKSYCKLLSPVGALHYIKDVLKQADFEVPEGGMGFSIESSQTLYDRGFVYTKMVDENPVDIYVPKTEPGDVTYAVVFLQGGKVDKRYYSRFAEMLSGYGFVVAVPNHTSLAGKNMTEQRVFNRIWKHLRAENTSYESPLFGALDISKVAVMGHSYGGLASLGIVEGKCTPPTCLGTTYDAPEELAAVALWGTNNALPVIGVEFGSVDNRSIPIVFLQGDRDGMALHSQTATTYNKTTTPPKAMLTIEGANHYGIANRNNPPGADPDSRAPELVQSVAIETISRWTGVFLRSQLFQDGAASDLIFGERGGQRDPNVRIFGSEQ